MRHRSREEEKKLIEESFPHKELMMDFCSQEPGGEDGAAGIAGRFAARYPDIARFAFIVKALLAESIRHHGHNPSM